MALLFAVFWGYLFYGVIDLFVFLQGREFHESFHLETAGGCSFWSWLPLRLWPSRSLRKP
jgi:hypothetical protein